MDAAELDRFATHYYEIGSPERACEALEAACRQVQGPTDQLAYFFGRVARGHPDVLRQFEGLFADPRCSHEGRLLVLKALQHEGDEQTVRFLEQCRSDPLFAAESSRIAAALSGPVPNVIDVPSMHLDSPVGLDLQWAEFYATGDVDVVRRLADVLEGPDSVRERLGAYLRTESRGRLRRWLRRATLDRLESRGILIDSDRAGIASAMDLDCHCSMRGFAPSREAWRDYRGLLPAHPEDVPPNVMLKAAAKWSLARHAGDHERVLAACEDEATRRVGRTRLSLLEVVAFTRYGRGDLGGALQAMHAALDPEPRRRQEAKNVLSVVMDLATRHVNGSGEAQDVPHDLPRAVAAETEAVFCYCSRLVVQQEPEEGLSSWDLEVVRPDKARVGRLAGSDADEWIIIGRHFFRSPAYMDAAGDWIGEAEERATTEWLLIDKYVEVLRRHTPLRIRREDAGAGAEGHLVFEYGADALDLVLGPGSEASGGARAPASEPLRLWVDATTNLLVRAELCLSGDDGDAPRYRMVQGFASFNEIPGVVPPPFFVLRQAPTRRS